MSERATSTGAARAIALDDAYVMHTYARYPVAFVGGEGAELVDADGRRYLDFLGGIGAVSLGHAHPAVVGALTAQANRLWQASNYFYDESRGELARMLSGLLGATTDEAGHVRGSGGRTGAGDAAAGTNDGDAAAKPANANRVTCGNACGTTWKSFFSNSGAESNEGAIKVARRWGARRLGGAAGIVTARQSFHGRTLATLSATGQDKFHASFGPMPAGFAAVPLNDIAALEQAIVHPADATGPVCAVMLECVQGEGGVWPADLAYLRDVRALTAAHGIALVIDEVQTGFFRCGAPFAFQLAGIEPDIVSMAKGIAGGFPCGAVAARAELADLMEPGDHGSTFGGNVLAAAVARATVETLVAEGVGEHVIAVGARLRDALAALPHVSEVRGRGLMLGAQLDVPVAGELVRRGLDHGLVLNRIGDSILRFLPPLVVTEQQVDEMTRRLGALIDACV